MKFFLNIYETFPTQTISWFIKQTRKKLKGTEITIQSAFSNPDAIKLEIYSRKIGGNSPDVWKLKNIFLNVHLDGHIKCNTPNFVTHGQSSAEREIYSVRCLH